MEVYKNKNQSNIYFFHIQKLSKHAMGKNLLSESELMQEVFAKI